MSRGGLAASRFSARAGRPGAGLAFWACLAVALLLTAAPLRLAPPGVPGLTPALSVLFYWGVFRPSHAPVWAVLVAGLVHEAIAGAPWGVCVAGYACAAAFARSAAPTLRRERFGALWVGFAFSAGAFAVGSWAATAAAARAFTPIDPFLWQAGLTSLAYPPLHRVFQALDRGGRTGL